MSEQETPNEFESLCAGYVLGALSEEDRLTFEKMLDEASPKQMEIYRQMVRIKDDLSLAADPTEPSVDLFDKILDDISEGETSGSAGRSGSAPSQYNISSGNGNVLPIWAFKAAAAVLLAGVLGLALYSQQQSSLVDQKETQISVLQSELEQRNELLTQLETELERKEELLAILESREVNLILMAGQETNPDGYGKIIWDFENEQALLQVANLPEPADDQDYQLWLIKDQQSPISAGVFSFEQPSTDLIYRIDRLKERPSDISNTFAVTLEPKGGAPQPTGNMYLVGQQN
ncbi:anti-sigma factor [Rhodohalobacter sp. 8-1]|uniref:anti-sigma factor n=1 Tax=Rhodohalobacter sp. 8-1 TaxID=3131972 RepID=UPI0030EDDB4D